MCGASRCSGMLAIWLTPYKRIEGTRVERLVPGTYRITARQNAGALGERQGTAIVDVTYASVRLRRKIVMRPIGTGKSIRGTVTRANGTPIEKVHVYARCKGGGTILDRSAETNANGEFVIADVGKPPCLVALSVPHDEHTRSVRVDKLPARGISLSP
jgi:hypothetical protein